MDWDATAHRRAALCQAAVMGYWLETASPIQIFAALMKFVIKYLNYR